MTSHVQDAAPTFKVHSGLGLRWQQLAFAVSAVRYLRKSKYPLFTIKGALTTYRAARALTLHKLLQIDDRFFTTPVAPHYPSAAFDHMVAGGGLNLHAAGTPLKQQISMILLGITRKCSLRCRHCYERFNIGPEDVVPVSRWKDVIREIQSVGAGVIVLSGGEPMQRYDGLIELLASGNTRESDFHLHTSGQGVTPEIARELRGAGLTAAGVGLDDVDAGRHDALRGFRGAHAQAVRALRAFHAAGVFTYTNMCLTKDVIRAGALWAYLDLVRDLNVGFIEMLEPRPCGGYASVGDDVLLTADERRQVMDFFVQGNTRRKYRHHPLIYHVAHTEAPEQMGCMMGGLSHMTIDSRGHVNPCVFLPVTFGNIMDEDFPTIYRRMREAIPYPVHAQCPSISMAPLLDARAGAPPGRPVPYETVRREWQALMKGEAPFTHPPQ